VTDVSSLQDAVRRQNEEMVELVAGLTDQEYGAACEDHSGTTVAEVAAHCAEGYEMTTVWLQRLTTRVAVPAEPEPQHSHEHSHPHEHPHSHPHPHPHEAAAAPAAADRPATAERLRAAGVAIVAQIGTLTEEDLRVVPPASPFADGTSALDGALLALSGHLQEHLECMRQGIAEVRRG
jgi:hypothetical protein